MVIIDRAALILLLIQRESCCILRYMIRWFCGMRGGFVPQYLHYPDSSRRLTLDVLPPLLPAEIQIILLVVEISHRSLSIISNLKHISFIYL